LLDNGVRSLRYIAPRQSIHWRLQQGVRMGRKQLKRMAQRFVKRAGIQGEEGVTISFGFKSLWAVILISFLEELPYVGLLMTFLTFGLHRIVLVTDRHAYIYSARPFHQPREKLAEYPVGSGTVSRVRGKLTFSDGHEVWHSPLFAWRVQAVEDAANGEQ
jgi:hypothetical protein